jgi:hypothetical protein
MWVWMEVDEIHVYERKCIGFEMTVGFWEREPTWQGP